MYTHIIHFIFIAWIIFDVPGARQPECSVYYCMLFSSCIYFGLLSCVYIV